MWVNWVAVLWILYDVAISIRTAHMNGAFSDHEWYGWFFCGLGLAVLAFVAAFFDRRADKKEIAGLNAKLDEQKERTAEQKGISLGMASAFGRRLEGIEHKLSDPQSRAAISELREEVVPNPALVYDSFDDTPYMWKSDGNMNQYVHLKFRNEPTGVRAPDAAAKLSWWDSEQKHLFTLDGKWEKADKGRPIDFLPNNASHGLDLFIYHTPEKDWRYALSDVNQPIDEKYRLHFGTYKVKVTISCEGYTEDFWFRVGTGPTPNVELSAQGDTH
jgi:hypothetical protein